MNRVRPSVVVVTCIWIAACNARFDFDVPSDGGAGQGGATDVGDGRGDGGAADDDVRGAGASGESGHFSDGNCRRDCEPR